MLDAFHEQVAGVPAVTFDLETTGLSPIDHQISLIGLGVPATSGFQCWIFDVQAETKLAEEFKDFWQGKQLKIGHNVKFDAGFLKQHIGSQPYPNFDTMLASQIIHNGRGSNYGHKLEDLVQRELKQTMIKDKRIQQSFKGGPYSKEQLQYLADDLVAPWLVSPKLVEQLQNEELDWVNVLELAALPALQEMELTGFAIDDESRVALQQSLEQQLEELTAQLPQLEKSGKGKKPATVEPLNINSHPQIKEYFQKTWRINLPDTKEETLVELARTTGKPEAAALAQTITQCRHLHKRLNTYVNHLQDKHRRSDGRVHGQFNPLGTVSGRISASNPNLQNIPIRTPQGREIRKAFVPSSADRVLVAADYSQVELRIAAAMSGERGLIEAFQQGEDIHSATAAKVFGVGLDEVTRDQRSQAKAVNFGILYGQGAFGLAETLGVPRREAKGIIEAYHAQFSGLQAFTQDCVAKAREKGQATTLMGRHRPLPDISSNNAVVRAFAERNAVNTPIQGSAADIIKVAMIDVAKALDGMDSKLIMQVHDELVVDAAVHELDKVKQLLVTCMEQAAKLEVPLEVEVSHGQTWLEAH